MRQKLITLLFFSFSYAEAMFEALYSSLNDVDTDDNQQESLSIVSQPQSLRDIYKSKFLVATIFMSPLHNS